MGAELSLVQPFRQLPAQAPFALWGIKMIAAMERLAGKWRSALAGNHKHQAKPLRASISTFPRVSFCSVRLSKPVIGGGDRLKGSFGAPAFWGMN